MLGKIAIFEFEISVIIAFLVCLSILAISYGFYATTGKPIGADLPNYSFSNDGYAPLVPFLVWGLNQVFPAHVKFALLPVFLIGLTGIVLSYYGKSVWGVLLYLLGNSPNIILPYVGAYQVAQALVTLEVVLFLFNYHKKLSWAFIPLAFLTHKFGGLLMILLWITTRDVFRVHLIVLTGYLKVLSELPAFIISAYHQFLLTLPLGILGLLGLERIDRGQAAGICTVLLASAFLTQALPWRVFPTIGTVLVIPGMALMKRIDKIWWFPIGLVMAYIFIYAWDYVLFDVIYSAGVTG